MFFLNNLNSVTWVMLYSLDEPLWMNHLECDLNAKHSFHLWYQIVIDVNVIC